MITGSLQAVSNCEDFDLDIVLSDDETGELIDLSTVEEVNIAIAPQSKKSAPVIVVSLTGGGIMRTELGMISCTLSARGLCPGTYDIGGTLTKDGKTTQFLIGTLPVLDGIISR